MPGQRCSGSRALERPDQRIIFPEAIGIAAEAVRRIQGLTAYDEQLLAALILADGNLAEMAAGEGKTLVAALVAFVFGLQGRGVHVATVNAILQNVISAFVATGFRDVRLCELDACRRAEQRLKNWPLML